MKFIFVLIVVIVVLVFVVVGGCCFNNWGGDCICFDLSVCWNCWGGILYIGFLGNWFCFNDFDNIMVCVVKFCFG